MKLNIKNTKEIIDYNLTLSQRGILITILILKDSDSKLTLAKVKTSVNMKEAREDLIYLHKKGIIRWSGYESAVIASADHRVTPEVVEIVSFMNNLYGRSFDPRKKSTTTNLVQRLNENSVEEIKLVIANRWIEWGQNPTMKQHLNPTTIFRPSKFDKYLEESLRTRKGEGIVSANKLDLKNGTEITFDIADQFLDSEFYNIKIYQVDEEGITRGNGANARRRGKDIKRTLLIQQNNLKQGSLIAYKYKYRTD